MRYGNGKVDHRARSDPDAAFEWAKDRESCTRKLDQGLDEETAKGWTVLSMKED